MGRDNKTEFDKAIEYVFDKTKELAPTISEGKFNDVVIGFDSKTTRKMAECFYNKGVIKYSKHAIDINKTNKRGLDYLIVHELSHFVVPAHNTAFENHMKRFGFNNDEDLIMPRRNRFLRCSECGRVTKPTYKIPQNYDKKQCDKCGSTAFIPCALDVKTKNLIELVGIKTNYNWVSFVEKR